MVSFKKFKTTRRSKEAKTQKEKAALDEIVSRIQELATELTLEDDPNHLNDREHLQFLLECLFDVICDLSEYKLKHEPEKSKLLESDKTVLKAWYALFAAVEIPSSCWGSANQESIAHGHFVSAHMILFVLHAFTHQEVLPFDMSLSKISRQRVDLQMAFNLVLDEALLAHFRAIWDESGRKEYFRWAMWHIGCTKDDGAKDGDEHVVRTDLNEAAMRCLTHAELWEVPGMTGIKKWTPNDGDDPIYKMTPGATGVRFGEPDVEGGESPVISQRFYSEGPLRSDMEYCLFEDDKEEWLRGPRFRRSKQFVIDVRQYMHPWLVRERRRLAEISLRGKLPNELQNMVYEDLKEPESPESHPYLSHLDLIQVYTPFPLSHDEETCDQCRGVGGMRQLTCPNGSIHVWNLALRVFHTFHKKPGGRVVMCADGDRCTGHHENGRHEIVSVEAFRRHLEDIVRARCGPDATLESVGFGGRTWNSHVSELGTFGLGYPDVETELRISGGKMFLTAYMGMGVGQYDAPCIKEDGTMNATTRRDTDWSWGRTEAEEKICKMYFERLPY